MSARAQDVLDLLTPIERRIPPRGIGVSHEIRKELLEKVVELSQALEPIVHANTADVAVLLKGVELAVINEEFYAEKDFETAREHLKLAETRLAALVEATAEGRPRIDWGRGLLVRGYDSEIDGSPQPYGLEIPESMDLAQPAPLLVWLHGRGDKTTDLHFIQDCLKRSQAFGGKIAAQEEWIVLHPFGRHCIGWKHAGERDVFDAINDTIANYEIDPSRIVLAGFSMGGAGAWHIGAHYADQFAAVHAGAGFAETKLYNNLLPENYPPSYEQALWGLYDAPNYARNFLNLPVVAYSGEIDKQKQAADVMEAALAAEGLELTHIIGPGMGHKYHDDSVEPILKILREAKLSGGPDHVELQTRTVRYGRMHWLGLTGMEEHWQDARLTGSRTADSVEITTKNATGVSISGDSAGEGSEIRIDGTTVAWPKETREVYLMKSADGAWELGESPFASDQLRKRPRLQGPIDDAFMAPFLVVAPSQQPENQLLQRWVDFELRHFDSRWTELFRGRLPVINDETLTHADIQRYNLICWGDAASNRVISEVLPDLPIEWDNEQLLVAGQKYDAATHIPVLIYPNPLNPKRYIVINSGLTFREGHDGTNSLQNPKLPDWAVLDLSQDPDEFTAGKVVAADFFDEGWQVKPTP